MEKIWKMKSLMILNYKKQFYYQELFFSFKHQLIGFKLFFSRKLFVFENGLLPKKPECAENGDGCGDDII